MILVLLSATATLLTGCGAKTNKTAAATAGIPVDSVLSYLKEPVTRTVVGDFKVISPGETERGDTVIADGYTGFDERALNIVATRVGGRIEKLFVKYINQRVRKGQALMKLYSPQLLSAQRNLLQAVKDKDTAIIASLRESLYNLGMYPQEVEQTVQTGRPIVEVPIYSPYDGIAQDIMAAQTIRMDTGDTPMTRSSGAPELLSIHEGMYVNAGQTAFSIQNIHRVWAILNVFSQDIAVIRVGDRVDLYAEAEPSDPVTGQVDFIPPYRTAAEKTTRIRVYLDRLPPNWKIGTLLRGVIVPGRHAGGWSVPLSAVNRLGAGSVVWVQDKVRPNVFHARNIVIGMQTGDRIRVISGLGEGDKIVENAAYMVDSDSFIQ
jgi:Cu(I)/Ag(I) efflux system membrane fusion protein